MSDQSSTQMPNQPKSDPAELAIKEVINLADRVMKSIEQDDHSAYLIPSEVLSGFDRAVTACNQMYGDRYYPDAQQQCVKNMFHEVMVVMKQEKKDRAFWESDD